jgi:PelA/Pel-15E family pectate lyase
MRRAGAWLLSGWGVAALFVAFAVWLMPWWGFFELDPDEGGNLAKGALVAQGFRLYGDIWSDQPPLVTWLSAALFRVTGPSMAAGRWLVLAFAALLVGTLFGLLRRWYGGGPALVGCLLLVLSTHFVLISVSFMIGLVGVSLCVASLAALAAAERDTRRATAWLVGAGVLGALAVATKLFVAPLVALLSLYAVQRHGRRAAIYGAALLAVAALVAWQCGAVALPQLSQSHLTAFAHAGYGLDPRLAVVRSDAALFALALAGLVLALRRRDWLPVAWLACGAGILSLHRPYHYHHGILLAVPAAWLATRAVRAAVDRWASLPDGLRHLALVFGAVSLLVAARGQLDALRNLAANRQAGDASRGPTRQAVLAGLRAHQGANPWVLTDRPAYAIVAGLRPLPELAVLSAKRMQLLRVAGPDFFNSLLDKYRQPQVLLLRHPAYPDAFTARLARDYARVAYPSASVRHFAPPPPPERRPSLDDFRDGIAHHEGAAPAPYARHAEDDFAAIAGTILALQHEDGGWPANGDPRQRLSSDERAALARRHVELTALHEKSRRRGRLYRRLKGSSFDNGATIAEIRYLMQVFEVSGDDAYRQAALRGVEYVLANQTACGGWPHSAPPTEVYHDRITFMDGVTIRALRLIDDIAVGIEPFRSLPSEVRTRAAAASRRGRECLLQLQVRIAGRRSGWAGQYDPHSLVPAGGRSFELAGLVSRETAGVVEYLMQIDDPSPAEAEAIESAVAWLRGAQLAGDSGRSAVWARFYDLESGRPFIADRDGRKLDDWTALPDERRAQYEWDGPFAQELLTVSHPAWQARRRAALLSAEAQ